MKNSHETLAAWLLRRGDRIEIIDGVVAIQSASNADIPPEWLEANRGKLACELLSIAGLDGYIYSNYTTGSYTVSGGKKADGITLIFESLLTGDTVAVTYNANLKRLRTTAHGKKGAALPKGNFSITKRHTFYKFWVSVGLPLPPRLSSFHDRMGKLKGLIFACEVDPCSLKVKNKLIPLLNITLDMLLENRNVLANSADNSQTSCRQLADNCQTKVTDKKTPLGQSQKGLEPNQSASLSKYETSHKESTYTRDSITPLYNGIKRVQDQSTDEWLAGYGD